MEKNRLEAFSDGVLAIIITIMILELKTPSGCGVEDLLGLCPVLVAYVISFVFIATYWVNHHLIFVKAPRINVGILWCNMAWLFAMSFIPFATAWVGSYPKAWIPLALYFADMSLACITFHLMCWLIAREARVPFRLGPRNIASLLVYTGAAVFGGHAPTLAYAAVALVSAWWLVPEKAKD